ncbi:MAG: N-6 DNA methylase [Clostridiales bacterium]|nr:N-6 DNA methylase [Clostridiales bacterium]
MNKDLIKHYLDAQPIKAVTVNWEKGSLAYFGIKQCQKRTEAKPEELVRAYLITKLVNELGYKPEAIEIEHTYTAGRPHTNTSRIDVIVRDGKGDAFLFIEVKNPDEYAVIDKDKTIEEQLFKVAAQERAENHDVKYLILYTINDETDVLTDNCIIIDNKKYNTYSDWEPTRNSTNTLPAHYGRAQKKPYIKGSDKDLESSFSNEMLSQLQKDLHNVLWGGGGTDDNEIFSSLTNLILTKIQDEDEKEDGETYDFQSLTFEKDGDEEFESNETLFERINALYRRALRNKLNITDSAELEKSNVIDSKKFSYSKLKYTVQKLENLSFVEGKNSLNGKDILGTFFEGIIRNGFKQSKGQFFTHPNVVRFMLWAIQADRLAIRRVKEDREIPYMIDPSAGSGTFLIEYMKFITYMMKYHNRGNNGYNKELGTSTAVRDKIESDWFYPDHRENKWAQTYIYGSEINFNLGTATKVNMILHGDGSTNIFVKDGLAPFESYHKEVGTNAMNQHISSAVYGDMQVNEQFDLILTNPPFSVELDTDTKKTIKKEFLFGEKTNSENLFVERWYQLLRENGRCAAILPESVFDTTSNRYIRLFIYKYFKVKAVVSLPQLTFEPYTPTKTSIVFLQKKTATEVEKWNELWTNHSNEYSKLRTRVNNLIAVKEGKAEKSKLSSIKDMTELDKVQVIRLFLSNNYDKSDDALSAEQLIDKYQNVLENLLKLCAEKKAFGYVNVWWVFEKVSRELNYDVFMAETENIGYKRYTKNKVVLEKAMPNELYRSHIDANGNEVIDVDDGVKTTILDYMREINWN